MKKIIALLFLTLPFLITKAQVSATIQVGGDADKFYPVTFYDYNWDNNVATELTIGRSSVHTDDFWKGAIIANFSYHTNNYGHRAEFIDASVFSSYNTSPLIGGWADATWQNGETRIIIWLKGGLTYFINSAENTHPVIYDGIQNPLPYQETNGPLRTYKTVVDDYVNASGSSSSGTAYFSGSGKNYFLGNVGIGTANPTEKLSVKGNIRAHEIKVETANWPDYVFENSYKVLSLPELEDYIKINKHLPEMPSAEKAEKEGVDLGEMNKLLLKKIEELTLHVIELDRKLDQQIKLNKTPLKRTKLHKY